MHGGRSPPPGLGPARAGRAHVGPTSWIDATNVAAASGQPALIPPNAFNPSTPAPDDGFSNLLYEEARTSHLLYDNVSDGWSFGAEFALGLKVGANLGSEEKTATVQDANFLGAPGQDGTRPMVGFETCVME
ncbi:hypothetical protein [Georgenia sp. AZ-5]|uniref:hypothetical protein n=1 Tax=Georgenia sp. AZ-5 TaxID=3367526 RepID=UPI0037551D48